LFDWNGHQVCLSCRDALQREHDEREAEAVRNQTSRALAAQREEVARDQKLAQDQSNQNQRIKTLMAAGMLLFLGMLLLTLVIFVVALPIPPGGNRPSDISDSFTLPTTLGAFVTAGAGVYFLYRYRRLSKMGGASTFKVEILLAGWRAVGLALFLALASPIIFIPFLAASFGARLTTAAVGEESPMIWLGKAVGFVIGIIGSAFLLGCVKAIEDGKCPNCGRLLKSVIESRTRVGQQTVTTRGHDTATVHAGYGTSGKVLQTITLPTTRSRTVDVYRVHRRCNACGHRWAK
jgi:hypothetical protein